MSSAKMQHSFPKDTRVAGNGVAMAGQDSKQCRNNFQNNVSVRNFNDCRYFNAVPSYCSHNADIHSEKYGVIEYRLLLDYL